MRWHTPVVATSDLKTSGSIRRSRLFRNRTTGTLVPGHLQPFTSSATQHKERLRYNSKFDEGRYCGLKVKI